MVTAFSSIAVNNMNKGERSDIDINSSEIKPVTTLTTKAQPASTSSTLTNKSPTLASSVTPHSPTVPALRNKEHKDEEKRIQMVIYFTGIT